MSKNCQIWNVGVSDRNLRVYGKVALTEQGITYSSYLVQKENGYVLFGAVPESYADKWLENIKKVTGTEQIQWLVLFDAERVRGSVRAILAEDADLGIIAPYTVLYGLKNMLPEGVSTIEIRTNRTLTLVGGVFQFTMLRDRFANPALYVLDQEENCVYTADAFGSLYGEKERPEDGADHSQWMKGMEAYCDEIRASKRPQTLQKAIDLMQENQVNRICPMYGPEVQESLDDMMAYYKERIEQPPKRDGKDAKVAIAYEGKNELDDLAQAVAQGLQEAEVADVTCYDLSVVDRDEAVRALQEADVLLFGTTMSQGNVSKPLWDVVTSLRKEDCHQKLVSVFYQVNDKGDNVDLFRQYLQYLGFDLSLQDYFIIGEMGEDELKNAGNYGFGVGCSIRRIPNPRQPKLVRCLVCGEIFDASLGRCPVCGVGLDQCVPVEEDEVSFAKDTDRTYVILGGGTAGINAADAIRSRDSTGRIVLVSAEDYLPINRPMLTKDLSLIDEMPDELFVHPREWYDERNIEMKLGESALSLDPENKIVEITSGPLSYDKLIFATGAECFIPPFEGWDKEGVMTIRHLSDSVKLKTFMDDGKNAVVIGGGVLGLEAANELMRAGIKVTVLEASPQIIGRQADADSAALMKKIMAKMGVECYEGVQIEAVLGDTRAEAVKLATGEVFPADFVVVSCGNRGNVQAAKEAGVEVERAIVVNQFMETNIPDIYACGDCCQYDGLNYQLWQEASSQGNIAGANAAGERVAYETQTLGLNLEGFGTTLFAIGDAGKAPDKVYHKVVTKDGVKNSQEQYWFSGHSLEGAVLIGSPEKTTTITQAVTTHARYEELFD